MFCKRCSSNQLIYADKIVIKIINSDENVYRVNCQVCNNFIKVITSNEIIDIDNIVDNDIEDGWKKAVSDREKLVYYVLSQIIYPEVDYPNRDKLESIYDCADHGDDIFLRWKLGIPVGFYTIKRKGTEISYISETYSMNTLDTAYIRSQYRNQGFGLEILYSIIKNYPNDHVGFSKPISDGMLRLLNKFLVKHKEYRRYFWEIEDGGNEGSAQLIWFNLKKLKKK